MKRENQKFRKRKSQTWRRLLPILGAGIVLVTFVVKEALREDLKDFVDAIDSAKGVYVIRNDFNNIAFQLRVIEQKVDRVEQITTSSSKDPFTLLTVNQQLMITRELHDGIDSSLDNIDRLSRRLEDSRKQFYKEGVVKLRNDLAARRKEFFNLGKIVARANSRVGPDLVPIPEDRVAIAQANTSIFTETNTLISGTQALSTKLLTEADSLEEEKQSRYEQLTKWSYVLFSVGWILGLVGKITGIDSDNDTD